MDSPLDVAATPERLRALHRAGVLSADAYVRSLELAVEPPTPHEQTSFAARGALILCGLLALAGVAFFVAHHWGEMSRWAKFGTLEIGLLACAGAAWRAKSVALRQVTLALCAAMLGPLLFVYGETYQTGADAYWLLLCWAVLAGPIAAFSRCAPLWAGAWGLVNASALLWCHAFEHRGLVIAALNVAALCAYEIVTRRAGGWLASALGVAALLAPLPDACAWLLRLGFASPTWGPVALAAVVVVAVGLTWSYGRDRLIRSVIAFAACGLGTAIAFRALHIGADTWFAWVPLGLFIVAEISLSAAWIRRAEAVR